jgi:hypothetical protein
MTRDPRTSVKRTIIIVPASQALVNGTHENMKKLQLSMPDLVVSARDFKEGTVGWRMAHLTLAELGAMTAR